MIHVSELIENSYLAEQPVDPTTNTEMSDCVVVTYQESANKYIYEYGECQINIVVNNTYIDGDRLMIFSDSSLEKINLVSELIDNMSTSDTSFIEKYETKEITENAAMGIMFDENDIVIDGFDFNIVKLPYSYMYMDFYHFFQIAIQKIEEDSISEGEPLQMHIFGDPDNLTIYFGMGYLGSFEEEDSLQ